MRQGRFSEAVLFWKSEATPVAALLCPYLRNQRVVAVFLFHYDGKANTVLYQSGNDSIAAQYFSLLDFGTDRRGTGMAWIYAGGI